MTKHFSKWIELVALPDKSNEGKAYALLDRVLSYFGAPTELSRNQTSEFKDEFDILSNKALINYCTML